MSDAHPAAGGTTKRHAKRRAGRALAVALLYGFDQKRYEDDGRLLPEELPEEPAIDAEGVAFARELFQASCAERTAIDAVLQERLNNWTLDRLAVIDRALLRLGAFELMYRHDVPLKVIINEYVELSKQYGSEDRTTKLVNGVLDRIARDFRKGS